jgi:ATP-dependent Lhr-like helicase
MTALTSGGTIPDTGDYSVMLEPQADKIGTVNEDFAVESLAGDVFQLGNTSYRILKIEPGRVRVEDAQGQRPTFRSGSARRRGAATSCRSACRACAKLVAQALQARPRPAMKLLTQTLGLDDRSRAPDRRAPGHALAPCSAPCPRRTRW